MKLSQDQIFDHIHQVLVDLFEVNPEQISPSAKLYDDLDIDSIDSIDMLIELKRIIGKDIDPQAFKHARTISDVANVIGGL